DIVIFSDNEINNPKEKNSGYSFTDIWQYIKRGKSRGNDHYEATCSFCNKKWSRGKPASLRAHIANHCTATNISADVRSYFIQVVANENENKRKYYSSDNEAK
ncbi:4543_t:CDS:1, partial [Rhizophagus irregularis]